MGVFIDCIEILDVHFKQCYFWCFPAALCYFCILTTFKKTFLCRILHNYVACLYHSFFWSNITAVAQHFSI